MYQRYTSRAAGPVQTGGSRMVTRIRNIVTLLLLVAVIVLAVFGGRAMNYQTESHTTYVRRMQTECNDALELTSALSRTAGASSSATLGRIRSYVYAMDTINQLNLSLEGRYLVGNDVFVNLYSIIDDYYNRLITGMVTSDQQTALTNALADLVTVLAVLE